MSSSRSRKPLISKGKHEQKNRSKSLSLKMSDFPKVTPVTSTNATDEERCRFLEELDHFLRRAQTEVGEKLHPEIEHAEKKLGPDLISSVQLCLESWKKLNRDLPDVASRLLAQCLEHLVPKMENPKKSRKNPEKIVDELHAAALVGILNALATPTCNPEMAKICIKANYAGLSRYLLAIPHRCTAPNQCACYQLGPIEDTVELVTLVSAAKFLPDVLVKSLEKFAKHYKNAISFNYANSLGLLYCKSFRSEVETQMPKVVKDLKCLLDAKKDMSRSTLMIRTAPGQYLSQGQPIDVVLVYLDIILKKISENDPTQFDKDAIDIVEQFYMEKRPMSCLICLEILKNLYRANLIKKERVKKYFDVANELELPEKEISNMKQAFA